ncbi:J domain-containing protein [Actinophytocola sp.]|uniref:J domain-containing protein n=1 Tax=Actinophytocola sp. TaxID=1872138 RepID=UPI002ED1ABFD
MSVRGIDYYELLGVARDASQDEIRSAYRALAKAMHPDAGGTAGAFRLLREAYETLADPEQRAEYDSDDSLDDGPDTPDIETDRTETTWQHRQNRSRRFREDESYEPALPVLEPETMPWWHDVRKVRRVVLAPRTGPSQAVALGVAGGVAVLVLLLALVGAPGWLVIMALLAGGAAAVETGRRHVAAQRIDREFTAEFGDRLVFGRPGTEPDEVAERLTAELLSLYLTRIPGVRICHGLAAEEGSVFADLDHAVLCGHRLVLIESKLWLPGHYEVDDAGEILRNGRRFRGGVVRLPERLAYYRALLPDVELRGALLVYPSRAGEITVGDGVAHTPERFVAEIGAWLATDPSTVDRQVFRTLLRQVTTT